MKRKIILSGELGKKFGRIHELDISSPGEAVRALVANKPDFAKYLLASEQNGVFYKVITDGQLMKNAEKGVHAPFSKTVRIVPVIAGAKKGGLLGILTGGLLIGLSFFLPGAALFGIAGAPSLASLAGNVGAAMLLGGVSQLLSPQRQPTDDEKNVSNFFDAPTNNAPLGSCVPLGYGRAIVCPPQVSAGITTDNYSAAGGVLKSDAVAKIIDLISEGPIKGLVTGDLKSVFLNKTAVMNADGSINFPRCSFDFRAGTNDQTYLPNFPDVEREEAVGSLVEQASPVVRSISDVTVNAVRVTLGVPALSKVDGKGNPVSTGFSFTIHAKPIGGAYGAPVINDTINGRTLSKYQRSYIVPLPGAGPWNIKVTRVSADSASVNDVNAFYWDSYTEIFDTKLRYPGSSVMGCQIYAEQFGSVPTRHYHCDLRLVEIPTNYDPYTRTYDGEWDGEFKIDWTNNPAWILRDLLTNTRYGLGQFVSSTIADKWVLYDIARYCDEDVPDGFGGMEPRFTCNVYIQEAREAFDVIQDFVSVFRGMAFYANGTIIPVQDKPIEPTSIFTNANVEDGEFNYNGTALDQRSTSLNVYYTDNSNFGTPVPEYVEHPEAIAQYGIRHNDLVAFACDSRGQAARLGKWKLYSDWLETEVVTFRAGADAQRTAPGMGAYIMDNDRAASRRGGRVKSATTTEITLDQQFATTPAMAYTMHVVLPNGSLVSKPINSILNNVAVLSEALSAAPLPNAKWVISAAELSPQIARILNVMDKDENGAYEITGLIHNPSKYGYIEQGLKLEETITSVINELPDPVENISVEESLYNYPSGVSTRISMGWDISRRAVSYIVKYQRNGGGFTTAGGIKENYFEINNVEPGTFDFEIYAVSFAGKPSIVAKKTVIITGKLALPQAVSNFDLVGISNGNAQLAWDKSTELDVINGGYVRIRHTPRVDGASWSNAVDIGDALPGSASTASLPHINGTYLAKFIDSGGRSSDTAAQIITTTASIVGLNVIEEIDESEFLGEKENVVYSEEFGGLTLESSSRFVDDWPNIDDVGLVDEEGGTAPIGTYNFNSTVDLGAVYDSVVTATITANIIDIANTIDARTDLMDSWLSFDGAEDKIDDVNAGLYVSTTEDDPSDIDAVWSTWRKFFVGQYRARGYKYKLVLESRNDDHNIVVTGLVVKIDMPDRVETFSDIASGTSEKLVEFIAPFHAKPGLGITPHNMATGDVFRITTAVDESGFGITFYNAAGTIINRTFDYMAKGYGYSS